MTLIEKIFSKTSVYKRMKALIDDLTEINTKQNELIEELIRQNNIIKSNEEFNRYTKELATGLHNGIIEMKALSINPSRTGMPGHSMGAIEDDVFNGVSTMDDYYTAMIDNENTTFNKYRLAVDFLMNYNVSNIIVRTLLSSGYIGLVLGFNPNSTCYDLHYSINLKKFEDTKFTVISRDGTVAE